MTICLASVAVLGEEVRKSELDVTVDVEILVVRIVGWSISLERFIGEF